MGQLDCSYAQLSCLRGNIGDEFQSLAAVQHFPKAPESFISRGALHAWPETKPVTLIMNGWFSHNPDAWPPAPSINPIFVGFHVTEAFKPTVRKHAEYLRRFEPIGVRDQATADFLHSLGIRTETTYCLTLTFPERKRAPKNGKVMLVDVDHIEIPKQLKKNSVRVHHMIPAFDDHATLTFARALLDYYRDNASLVVTKRLHAALPCIAMGIPVIFFGDPNDERTAIVRDIGCTIHNKRLHKKGVIGSTAGQLDRVDWSPAPIDVSQFKEKLARAVATRLEIAA